MSRTLGPGLMKIGQSGHEKDWSGEITKIEFKPDTKTDDPIPVLSGANIAADPETTWKCSMSILQDFVLDGLIKWCLDHEGEIVPFVFNPDSNTSTGITVSGSLQIVPIGFGGDVKKKNESDAEFTLIGKPTIAQRAD